MTARRYRRPVPIDTQHDTSGFASGYDVLDDWLKTKALKAEGRSARTYVVCERRAVVALLFARHRLGGAERACQSARSGTLPTRFRS